MNITFENLITELHKIAPGMVTTVSDEGLQFALDCGVDVWDFAETLALQRLIAAVGTPAQKKRLAETLIASRWATEIEDANQT